MEGYTGSRISAQFASSTVTETGVVILSAPPFLPVAPSEKEEKEK